MCGLALAHHYYKNKEENYLLLIVILLFLTPRRSPVHRIQFLPHTSISDRNARIKLTMEYTGGLPYPVPTARFVELASPSLWDFIVDYFSEQARFVDPVKERRGKVHQRPWGL